MSYGSVLLHLAAQLKLRENISNLYVKFPLKYLNNEKNGHYFSLDLRSARSLADAVHAALQCVAGVLLLQ